MRKIGKKKILIMIPLLIGLWSLVSWASFLTSGEAAPNFIVESGDGQKLTLAGIRGKVIVLFYEFRDSLGQNNALKDMLKEFYRSQPADSRKDVFRLVVVDCSESNWATSSMWKSKLREHSVKEGFTIYGDWTRRMFNDYRMQADKSNFLVIDKQGIVRYSATGKVNPDQFGKIKELLQNLIKAG